MHSSLLSVASCLLVVLLCTPTTARSSHSSHHASSPRGTGEYDREAAEQSTNLPYASDECNGQDWGTAGQFDLYVLAQQWPAEYCHSKSTETEPGCAQPTDWQRVNLTLHGLWPQYAKETDGHPYPQCCESQYGQELTEAAVQPLLTQLQRYWPNEQSPSGQPLQNTLWYHEYAKHGTCSGLPQSDYLQLAFTLMQALPTKPIVTDNIGGTVQLDELESAYNNGQPCAADSCMVWVQCSGAYLTELHTCWSQSGQQVVCPTLVVSEKSQCKSGAIKISAFSGQASARDEL